MNKLHPCILFIIKSRNEASAVYSITIEEVQKNIALEGLLREIVTDSEWVYRLEDSEVLQTELNAISYNSKEVDESTLFFCKGSTFKEDYLREAVSRGVSFYISEYVYDIPDTIGIIVSDIRKVMALIAKEFYNRPDEKLKIAGITGTKGKTTTTYFTKHILNQADSPKTAIISTIDVSLDGMHSVQSKLTTPESLDLYPMIARAVENGMDYLVMEVSSQAFKLDRVFGITFDIGVFLNISRDHIGPNEHPTMEDYFYCKRQLIAHSKIAVINSGMKHFKLIHQEAKALCDGVIVYGFDEAVSDYRVGVSADDSRNFDIIANNGDALNIAGDYSINLLGGFNKENALSSAIIASLFESSREDIKTGLAAARIPGRMEVFSFGESNYVYVDFAHNYISLKSLLDYTTKEHPDHKLTVILGAPGGKGVSRRKDMGEVLSDYSGTVILTEDDPNRENPRDISQEIAQAITGNIQMQFIDDRIEAIKTALNNATDNELIVIAGKGSDTYMLYDGVKEPYTGDNGIVEQFIEKLN